MPPEAPKVRLDALFLGRRRDGNDDVLPRIQRRRYTPDGAALAGGIRSLEGQDERVVAKRLALGELEKFRLPFRKFPFVGRLGEFLREVETTDQRNVADDRRRGCHQGSRRGLRPRADIVHGPLQYFPHRQVAIIGVGALDDVPRRRPDRRFAQHLLPDVVALAVVLERALVHVRHAPARLGVGREFMQSLLLGGTRQVDPELQQDDALVREHLLVLPYVLQMRSELRAAHRPPRVRGDEPEVPRVHEDAQPAAGGSAPIPPRQRPHLLFGRAGPNAACG
jgi:hypothetical protein